MAGAYRTHASGNQITGAVGDQLYSIFVINGDTGTPTVTDDQSGGTYTSVGSALFGSSTCKVWVFARDHAVTSAVAHTITASFAGSPNNFMQDNHAWTGLFANGAASIRSSGTQANQALGNTPAPTLNQAALSTNPILGVIGNQRNSAGMTAPAGFTLRYDDGTQNVGDTFETGIHDSTRDSGFSGTTVTWGSTSLQPWGAILLELSATDPSAATATGLASATALSRATLIAKTRQTTTSGPALASDYGIEFDRELSRSFDNERIFQLDPPTGASGAITANSTPLHAAAAISSATLRSTGKLSTTCSASAAVSPATLRSTGKLSATSASASAISVAHLAPLPVLITATTGASTALSSGTLRSTGRLSATSAAAGTISVAGLRSTGILSETSVAAASLASATLRSIGRLSIAAVAASAVISSAHLTNATPASGAITATSTSSAALSSAALRSTGTLSGTSAVSAVLSSATLRSIGRLSATSSATLAQSSAALRSTGRLSATTAVSMVLSGAALRCTGKLTATSSASFVATSATLRSTGRLAATVPATAAWAAAGHVVVRISATLPAQSSLSASTGNVSNAMAAHLGANAALTFATLRSITGALPPTDVGSLTSLVAHSQVVVSIDDGVVRVMTIPGVLTVTGLTS